MAPRHLGGGGAGGGGGGYRPKAPLVSVLAWLSQSVLVSRLVTDCAGEELRGMCFDACV